MTGTRSAPGKEGGRDKICTRQGRRQGQDLHQARKEAGLQNKNMRTPEEQGLGDYHQNKKYNTMLTQSVTDATDSDVEKQMVMLNRHTNIHV